MYDEAFDLVRSFGIEPCPHILPERAIYRHASAAGASVIEFEPCGKAAAEIAVLHKWTVSHVNKSTRAIVEAQVRRPVTQDGGSLLGRIVPADVVNVLLDKLGLGGRIVLSADQLVDAALGLSLKRSRVNGEQRLEILGFDPLSLPSWRAKGCFTEIIAYQTRLFVPVSRAQDIVAKLAA